MEYRNHKVGIDETAIATSLGWLLGGVSPKDVVTECIITVKKAGVWASHTYQTQATPPGGFDLEGAYPNRQTTTVSRYNYGVKVNFLAHGRLGHWDWYQLMNAVVQGVVFLGLASTVTKLWAFNCLGLLDCIHCPGLSGGLAGEIYYGQMRQDVSINVKHQDMPHGQVLVRGAVIFAGAAKSFFNQFAQKDHPTRLDRSQLFGTLQCMLSDELSDEQLGAMVMWICDQADKDGDSNVSISNWMSLVGDEASSIQHIVTLFQEERTFAKMLEICNGKENFDMFLKHLKDGVPEDLHQLRYQVELERERERQHCDEEIARMSSIDRAMSTLGYNDRTNFASYPGVPRGPGRPWTERAAMGLEEGACGGQESLAVVGEARPSASDDKAVHGLVPSDMR